MTGAWIVGLGRALLAIPFVDGSVKALRAPGPLPDVARRAGVPNPELTTKVAAGAMLVGALALGTGVAPVLGGTMVAGSLIGTTAVVHRFWADQDPAARAVHQKAFIANCGLLGGVLVAVGQGYAARRLAARGR